MTIEKTILRNLVQNKEYARRVLPYLKPEYFEAEPDKLVFKAIYAFVSEYNTPPSIQVLEIETDKLEVKDSIFKEVKSTVSSLSKSEETNYEWLFKATESWCQDRAIYNAMVDAMDIMTDDSGTKSKGVIPSLLSDALAVTFAPNIGHNFLEDFEERFEKYHAIRERIPFDIEILNRATGGGYPRKTLNVVLAGVNVGKTMFLCHLAAHALSQGRNVIYFSMEISESEIARRVEANLLNVSLAGILRLSKNEYIESIKALIKRTSGQLIIKELPSIEANYGRFKNLLHEARIKKGFIPDLIIVDYIGITGSSRLKLGGKAGLYEVGKSVSEELRSLAVEFDAALWSAAQVNRQGFQSSNLDMDNAAESFGLPMTCDFIIGAMQPDELKPLNQMLFKIVKSRYGNKDDISRFIVGVDKATQRFYNVEQSAQANLVGTRKTAEKTEKLSERVQRKMRSRFAGIKV
jgi:replicative DNA helicase